jgi:uroporphyrinogen-III synthase
MNLIYFFRAEDDFQRYVKENNLNPLIHYNEPIFEYKLLNFSLRKEYELLIITSRMTIKSLIKNKNINQNIQIILVGEKSSKLLKENHFNNILYVANNVEELLNFIDKNELYRKKTCYLRGNYITYDICKKYKNFNEKIIYEIYYKNTFSDQFKINLQNNQINKFIFFSSKSIKEFIRISSKENLIQHLKNIDAHSINRNFINEANKKIFKNIKIFEHF